jgi:hypothetical protein
MIKRISLVILVVALLSFFFVGSVWADQSGTGLSGSGTITVALSGSLSVVSSPSNGGSVTGTDSMGALSGTPLSGVGPKSLPVGDVVTLTATASSNYTFIGWTGPVTNDTVTIAGGSPTLVTARFLLTYDYTLGSSTLVFSNQTPNPVASGGSVALTGSVSITNTGYTPISSYQCSIPASITGFTATNLTASGVSSSLTTGNTDTITFTLTGTASGLTNVSLTGLQFTLTPQP